MFLIRPYLVQPIGAITRASTATYTDTDGILKYAAINQVRPIIEETGSTNIVLYSSDISQYDRIGNITEGATTGPDGTSNAIKLTISKTDPGVIYGVSAVGNKFDVVKDNTYAFSIYVKKVYSVSHARLYIDPVNTDQNAESYIQVNLSTGVLTSSLNINTGSFHSESLANGWWRIGYKKTYQVSRTGCSLRVYLCSGSAGTTYTGGSSGGSDADSLAYFGFQVEADNISSYIPTTGTAATRAPDIVPTVAEGVSSLISSNQPFNDYPEWSAGTAYVIGDRVIAQNFSSIYIYEAIAASTGVNPTTDTTNKWLNIGAVNRWKMFDNYLSTSTVSQTGGISVTIRPGASIDAIGLFNVKARSVRVVITDSIEGEVVNNVYNTYTSTLSESNWYNYFFENENPPSKNLVIDDFPRTGTAFVSILLENGSLPTECGLLVIGRKRVIGSGVEYGTTSGIVDYSTKTTDQFGNTSVVERSFADRLNYRVFVNSGSEYNIKSILASVRSVPCMYVGNKDIPSTISYGYFKNFDIAFQYPSYSDYNLEIEGLT